MALTAAPAGYKGKTKTFENYGRILITLKNILKWWINLIKKWALRGIESILSYHQLQNMVFNSIKAKKQEMASKNCRDLLYLLIGVKFITL